MQDNLQISDYELDAIKETANIGAGSLSMALSKLFRQKVVTGLPATRIIPVESIKEIIAPEINMQVFAFSRITNGLEGNIIFRMSQDVAFNTLNFFRGEKKVEGFQRINDEDRILLKKVSSVVFSTYLTSLAKFFEKKFIFSPPTIISCFGDSVNDFIVLQISPQQPILVITIDFKIESEKIEGNFIFLFSVSSLMPLLSQIKKGDA